MMLSEFIVKLEVISRDGNHPKTTMLVEMLKQNLSMNGDIEFDVEHMCKTLGIERNGPEL